MLIVFTEWVTKGKDHSYVIALDGSLWDHSINEFRYLSAGRVLMKLEQILAMGIAYPQTFSSVRM